MVSRTLLSAIGIAVWTAVLVTAAPGAITRHRVHAGEEHAISISTHHNGGPIASCSDLNVEFDGHRAVIGSEERTISKAEAPNLRVNAESNGGLQVEGWDKDSYAVTLCKAAEEGSDTQSLLAQIRLTFSNGELGVSGPRSHDRWTAHLLLKAPRAAAME